MYCDEQIAKDVENLWSLVRDLRDSNCYYFDFGPRAHAFMAAALLHKDYRGTGRIMSLPDDQLFGLRVNKSRLLPPDFAAIIYKSVDSIKAINWYNFATQEII